MLSACSLTTPSSDCHCSASFYRYPSLDEAFSHISCYHGTWNYGINSFLVVLLYPMKKLWAISSTLYSSFLRYTRTTPIMPHIPFISVRIRITGLLCWSQIIPTLFSLHTPKLTQIVILLSFSIISSGTLFDQCNSY